MSQSTKQPKLSYRLWLRLGRLMALTGVISLLATLSLASLGACAATPQPPVEVPLPNTPSPTSTPPPSTPSLLITPTPVISFNMNDFNAGLSFGPWGLTTTFYLLVANRAPITGPETIMYIYDGDPQAGGGLIAQEIFPHIPPKANGREGAVSKEVIWNVRGKAGEQSISTYLCLADIQPSPTTCHSGGGGGITIPRLVWDIEILNGKTELEFGHIEVKNRFERGDTVKFRAFATNLTANETFIFTMTTTFYKDTPLQKLFAEENVTLPPGQMFEQRYEYETTAMLGTRAGIFLDLDGLQSQFPTLIDRRAWEKSTSFTFPRDAYFIAEPLTGTAPLTVSFRDSSFSSPDGYPMDNWLWSFGDGLTSTERFPTHTYTVPGNYTVALTSTAMGNNLWEVTELLRTKGISGYLATQTFIYTHTRSGYIEVLPPDDGAQMKIEHIEE